MFQWWILFLVLTVLFGFGALFAFYYYHSKTLPIPNWVWGLLILTGVLLIITIILALIPKKEDEEKESKESKKKGGSSERQYSSPTVTYMPPQQYQMPQQYSPFPQSSPVSIPVRSQSLSSPVRMGVSP